MWVEGHTCSKGTPWENETLGLKRAETVAVKLMEILVLNIVNALNCRHFFKFDFWCIQEQQHASNSARFGAKGKTIPMHRRFVLLPRTIGPYKAIENNEEARGRQLNRRVEIICVPENKN